MAGRGLDILIRFRTSFETTSMHTIVSKENMDSQIQLRVAYMYLA